MECREWRERISALIDGEISPSEARLVESHLEECAECRAVEQRMRAVGIGVARSEAVVPPDFREKLFARLEAEELLPRRRSLFVFSLRWAAVPVAAAAALALFLLVSTEVGKDSIVPPGQPSRVAQPAPATESREPVSPAVSPGPQSATAPRERASGLQAANGQLSPEEREIVAYLDVLEDPSSFDAPGDVDEMEIFEPPGGSRG